MEKIKQTKEAMESGEFDFQFVSTIPYAQKEEQAMKLADATVVCDEDGVAYISYQHNLWETFLIAEYYTNIDTSDWDTDEGRMMIFDFMHKPMSNGSSCRYDQIFDSCGFCDDHDVFTSIYYNLKRAMVAKHERASSLSYKIGKSLESVIGDGNIDIIKSLAESREVSEKLIDMLGVFRKDQESKDKVKAAGNGILNFSKK